MQRTLLSALTEDGSLFLSALKIAAWCRQMVEVCIHMLVNITFGLDRPEGSLRWAGRHREVLRRMLSRCRCRFQNSPLRSLSRSSTSGRCRWRRLRPNRHAIKTMPPIVEILPAPDGVMDSRRVCVSSGLLISKASSDEGMLVITSFSSIVMGHPVPMLAYLSSVKAIQNVRLRSSLSVQSRGDGIHIFTSKPAPSRR